MKPWKKVAIPHRDVSAGRYQQAEFAADLAEVRQGKADPEYQDSVEFFGRTYLTEGMKRLMRTSIERVTGSGGEPVVKLKTSFGGGKTHTMLALFHLFRYSNPKSLQGIEELMNAARVSRLPKCSVAVLVGTALDPAKPRSHPELQGLQTKTLWGEMAAQIGGKEAHELLKNSDEKGVAPGSDTMVQLFDHYGPCIILIDEMVAYARNIYHVSDLPGGSFDSNMTFIHNLTEAAKRSKNSMVIASIPESNIEIGGEGGQAALERLENTFARLEAVWQPVGALESFEIVRRRIFSRIESEKERDVTCSAFHRMYRDQANDFPTKCKEKDYLDRLKASYPFHPEFFDRLYEDWATLERFQRTRGVLRLAAAVVFELWSRNDQSPMILPGSLPLYSPKIRDELTRYVGDQWAIIVDKDVDGEQSEPYRVDQESPRIGSIMAARRVARTIFLGSAPSVRQQKVRGIEDIRIKLGVAQPEENLPVFSDALSRLCDRLTYLYSDNKRYWYDTRPNLRRTVEDRAAQFDSVEVETELKKRLQKTRERGDFVRVHVMPEPEEVPDEQEARLVILGPDHSHRTDRMGTETPAQQRAQQILESKGRSPRIYRNTLMFLAPDTKAMENCLTEIRRYLAWMSVLDDKEALGLDAAQEKQAEFQKKNTDATVNDRISDTYSWIIVPYQETTNGQVSTEVKWEVSRVSGGREEGIVTKASRKAVKEQKLIAEWSPILLKMELDRLLWKESDSINLRQLWDYMTTYLYLPRLRNQDVLVETIRNGLISKDFFAYSAGKDANGRYLGLLWETKDAKVLIDGSSLLVKREVAEVQIAQTGAGGDLQKPEGPEKPEGKLVKKPIEEGELKPKKRFYGSVTLDPQRVARDAGVIAQEVIAHLAGLPEAEIEVHMEIQARIPKGVPDKVENTVSENARTLKFETHEFEEE